MYQIFSTNNEAQIIIDKINTDYINSKLWKDSKTTKYGDPILLEDGRYAIRVLTGYESYFDEIVENITPKKIKITY